MMMYFWNLRYWTASEPITPISFLSFSVRTAFLSLLSALEADSSSEAWWWLMTTVSFSSVTVTLVLELAATSSSTSAVRGAAAVFSPEESLFSALSAAAV